MGDLLRPCDLEKQFTKMIEDATSFPAGESEVRLPAITNVNRDRWAEGRQEHFSNGVNRDSLRAIETAAFIVAFSSKDFIFKENEIGSGIFCWLPAYLVIRQKLKTLICFATADESVRRALHGDGHTYWFDKSLSICFHPNSRVTANCEHSWADAPISSQIFEYGFYQEVRSLGYTLGMLKNSKDILLDV